MTDFEEEVIEPEVPAADLARGDTKAIFESFGTELSPIREQAQALIATGIIQVKEKQMTQARKLRLAIRNIRIMVENKRKDMVADYKKRSGEIDTQARGLRSTCELLETKLEDIEKFAEREEERKRIAMADSRRKALADIGVTETSAYNLETMSEFAFAELTNGLVLQAERKTAEAKALAEKQAQQKAESDRVFEQNRILVEAAAKTKAAQNALDAENARKESENRKRVEAEHQRALKAARDKADAQIALLAAEKKALEEAAPAMREALKKIIALPLKPVPEHCDDSIREAMSYNEALEECQEIAKAGLNNVSVATFEDDAEETK